MKAQFNYFMNSGSTVVSSIRDYPNFTKDMLMTSMESVIHSDQFIRVETIDGSVVSINTDHIEYVGYTFFVKG